MNTDQLEQDYIDSFLSLAAYEGGTYGVWFKNDSIARPSHERMGYDGKQRETTSRKKSIAA